MSSVLLYIIFSICMTTFSTLFGIGMMPLNLFIYTTPLLNTVEPVNISNFNATSHNSNISVEVDFLIDGGQHHFRIPYIKLVLGLVFIIIPVSIGLVIHHQWPRLAVWVKRVGASCTALSFISATILQRILYGEEFLSSPWQVILAAAILPAVGFLLGYTLMRSISHLPIKQLTCVLTPQRTRTVSIEVGCQNTVLAIAIISISFPVAIISRMMPFLIFFGAFFSVEAFIICAVVRLPQLLRKWRERGKEQKQKPRQGEEQNKEALDNSLAKVLESPSVS